MDTEKKIVIRRIDLNTNNSLLDILTCLPKNVPYNELILHTCAEEFEGRHYGEAWLEYRSLETDSEFQSRINLEKIRQQNDEARERRQYEYLKTKYGS